MKSLHSLSYKTLFTILFFAIAGIVLLTKFTKPNPAAAGWWNDSWHYRQAISVANSSGSELTDFQVAISIGTSQLVADGKMQSDCDDIRITDQTGNLLPYWIEENNPGCNSPNGDTKIWVKANSLPTSGATVYVYYGNSSADNNENGDSVFEFFDDFNGTSLNTDKWINTSGSNWSLSSGFLNITSGSNNNYLVANKSISISGFTIESRVKANSYSSSHIGLIWHANTSTGSNHRNDQIYLRPHSYNNPSNIQPGYFNGSLNTFSNTTGLFNYNTWYNIRVELPSSNSVKYYRDDINENNFSNQQYQTNTYTGVVAHAGGNVQWDYFLVHKYASTQPTTSNQSEESGGGPIAYWKFDEGSGTTAYDSAGTNNGTLSGSTLPEWQTEENCVSGKCLNFTSSNYNYIDTTDILNFTNVTFSFWIKVSSSFPAGSRIGNIIGNYSSTNNINIEGYTNGKIRVYWNAGQINLVGNQDIRDDKWHYISVVRNNSTNKITIYIDSKVDAETTAGSDISMSKAFRIGGDYRNGDPPNNPGIPLTAVLDEVKIYPYARTADQIKQDYNSRGSLSGSGVNLGVKSNTAPSIKSSLIGYWKLDENNGTKIFNSGSLGGVLNGDFGTSAPTWTSNGKKGKSLTFNNKKYAVIINGNNLIYNQNGFTYSAWIKPNILSGSYNMFMGQYLPYFDIYGNKLHFSMNAGGSQRALSGQTNINTGQWYYVTATYDLQGYMKVYLNGKLDGTAGPYLTPIVGNQNFYLGTWESGLSYPFDGDIDEVKIYNRALTADEIKQDYNAGSAIQFGSTNQTIGGTTTSLDYCIPGDTSYCATPVAEWNFEENTGTTAKDTSGNNYDGTFNNSPTWSAGKNNKGSALNFSYADNSSVTTTFNSQLTSYTAEAWIKPTGFQSANWNTIMATSSGYALWFELTSSGEISAHTFTNSTSFETATGGANITTGKWYHIAVSATQNGTATIYVNGVGLTSFTAGSDGWSGSAIITLGDLRAGRNLNFNGIIDEAKIYDYIRTPAQIAYDYNKGAPVGWWKLDECQGSTVFDSSGLGNTGAISIGLSGSQTSLGTCQIGTSAAWTNGSSGHLNGSLNFDGTDDYMTAPISVGGSEATVSFWVKNPKTGTSSYLFRSNANVRTYITISGSNIGFTKGNPYVSIPGSSINTSTWNHIVLKWWTENGTTYALSYINGKPNNSGIGTSFTDNTQGNYISIAAFSNNGDNYTSGQFDDVRIYNYALTSEQVKQVYNGGAVNFQ